MENFESILNIYQTYINMIKEFAIEKVQYNTCNPNTMWELMNGNIKKCFYKLFGTKKTTHNKKRIQIIKRN